MNAINEIMTTEPAICTPLTSIENIQKLLADTNSRQVMVVDTLEEKHLLGFITESDILAKSNIQDVKPESLNAEQCMRPILVTVRDDATIEECYGILNHYDVEQVGVVDKDGHLCGVYDRTSLNQVRQ